MVVMGLGEISNSFKTLVDKFPGNFHLEYHQWIEQWHCDNIKKKVVRRSTVD